MSTYVYVFHEHGIPVYVGRGTGNRCLHHLADKPWAEGRQLSCDVYPTPLSAEMETALILALTPKKMGGSLENLVIPAIDCRDAMTSPLFKAIMRAYKTPKEARRELLRIANEGEKTEKVDESLLRAAAATYSKRTQRRHRAAARARNAQTGEV